MRLLESEGVPERRAGGATMSLVMHAAIIVGAVAATAHRTPATPDAPEQIEIIYEVPPPEDSRPAPRTPSGPSTPVLRPVGPIHTMLPPPTIPDHLPPIDVADVSEALIPVRERFPFPPGDSTREGGFGRGTGSAGSKGTPDANGTWDAHAVEVPVVPDARNAVPSYPEMLRTAGVTGRVVAEFIVDSTGRVRPGSLVIVEATHELFATSVRRTVPSFRFTPARVQRRPVAQRVRVPFEFEMAR